MRYTDRDQGEGRKRRAKLIDAVAKAVAWYHERLLSAPDAARARGYLRERGLTGDEVRAYQIGWAPEGWDELARALRLPDELLYEAGLARKNSRGRPNDFFRGRVLFPIFDVQGDPVAFGGRILPGGEGSKYWNSTDTPIYNKSKTLYGLNWAKGAIVAEDEAIVCEGYTDVIGLANGRPAPSGRHLRHRPDRGALPHAEELRPPGGAGLRRRRRRARTRRPGSTSGSRPTRSTSPSPRCPKGVDPADLARRDPEALVVAIKEATPFLGFRLNRVLDAASLVSPEGRARAAGAAIAVIDEHPNPLVRDGYLMEVASRCRIPVEQLRAGTFARPAAGRPSPQASGRARAVRVDTTAATGAPTVTRPRSRHCACWWPIPT